MKILWHEKYAHPLPSNHKFPMAKYNLLPEYLITNNIISPKDVITPHLPNNEDILLAHTKEYFDLVMSGNIPSGMLRRIGFPNSIELVERELLIMQGSIMAAEIALKEGIAFNIAGGTHHAFSNKGEGFCIFNDMAIAAHSLLKKELAKKVLIIDLDVHQGNGTAEICANNENIFTFSMHGKDNYPLEKEKSSLDIELPIGIEDIEYLDLLNKGLQECEARFGKADIILYQSGVDILSTDKFGKLNVSLVGCKIRDEMVYGYAKSKNIPVAATMGGGYSPNIEDIIKAHINIFLVAKREFGVDYSIEK